MKRTISTLLVIILVLSLFTISVSANEPTPPDEPQYVTYKLSGSATLLLSIGGVGSANFNVTVNGNERDYGSTITFILTSFNYSVSNVPSGYTASANYVGYTVTGGIVYARIRCELSGSDTIVSHTFSVQLAATP